MYDFMFRNALIVDGTGCEPYRANLAVFGDRIAFIGSEGISRSRSVIDASSLVLAPGFIDMHTHTDLQVLRDRDMKAKIGQGIVTDVSGNCGIGVFPNSGEALHDAVEDVLGTYDDWSWKDYDGYRAVLMRDGIGINEAFLASHTALRYAAMGEDAGREATGAEISAMCSMLDDLLSAGVWGFSSGLYYSPCLFARHDELEALLQAIGDAGSTLRANIEKNTLPMKEFLDAYLRGSTDYSSLEDEMNYSKVLTSKLEAAHLVKVLKAKEGRKSGEADRILASAPGFRTAQPS